MGKHRVKIPGFCPLCISKCGTLAVVEDGRLVGIEPLAGHPTGDAICAKGRAAVELVYHSERVLSPMRRTSPKGSQNPSWEPITWDEALAQIVAKLEVIAAESGPEAVTFGVTTPSATAISDSFVWINRLARAFGSPNVLFATENCNWHRDFVPKYTHGGNIGVPDYEHTGCIILWGFNPAQTWLAHAGEISKAQRRGAKLVVIDPRRVGLGKRADAWLRIRPGADGALALALAYQLLYHDWYDQGFVRSFSNAPLLVRRDNGALLTIADLHPDAAKHGYVAWDAMARQPVEYHPDLGEYFALSNANRVETDSLALFGDFEIATVVGLVTCSPVFQLYYEICSDYTPEKAAEVTDVPASQIVSTARLIHQSGPVSFFTWTGTAQTRKATQTGRAITLAVCAYRRH